MLLPRAVTWQIELAAGATLQQVPGVRKCLILRGFLEAILLWRRGRDSLPRPLGPRKLQENKRFRTTAAGCVYRHYVPDTRHQLKRIRWNGNDFHHSPLSPAVAGKASFGICAAKGADPISRGRGASRTSQRNTELT